MKKVSGLLAVVLSLVFIACQKEIDWGTGNSSTGSLLIKIHTRSGSDSTVTTYTYNAQSQLIREKIVGIGNGIDLGNDFIINRNGSGIITTTVQKSALMQQAGVDSVIVRYYYNTGTSRYTSSAFDLTVAGFTVTDSAIYTYDGSGRIIKDEHFLATGILPPFLAMRNVYTYNAAGTNLLTHEQLAVANPGDPLETISLQTYTYDSKVNPLISRNEAIVLNRTGLFNSNNATKLVLDSPADPSINFTMDNTYRYNSNNTPDSSFTTRNPGSILTVGKYFYQ